jgi:membrane protease YdiL (CAAX protease family)
MNKPVRNLILFAVVTLGAGFVGLALDRGAGTADPQAGPGILLWLVAPTAAALLLRALGGDGWKDFGIGPMLRTAWPWYLIGLLIVTAVVALGLGLSVLAGTARLPGLADPGAFLPLLGAAFAASFVKNIFEEIAWRGYLTPRLRALRLHPAWVYLITGVIWAGWHIPYYLYFLDQATLAASTSLSAPALIGLAFVLLPLQAVTYGELRAVCGSVWPGVFAHTLANALTFALLAEGYVELSGGAGALLSPGTDGLLHAVLFALAGIGVYTYRVRTARDRGIRPDTVALRSA